MSTRLRCSASLRISWNRDAGTAAPAVGLHHLAIAVVERVERGHDRGAILDGADIDLVLPMDGEHERDDGLVELHPRQRHVLVGGHDAGPLGLGIPMQAVSAAVEEGVDRVAEASVHDRVVGDGRAAIAREHELVAEQEVQCLAYVRGLLGAEGVLDLFEFAKHGLPSAGQRRPRGARRSSSSAAIRCRAAARRDRPRG